jgi:glutamate---cysteine ligase / carboxylate-amine ligase
VTIAARFGAGTPLGVGVEEELMMLDAQTLQPVPEVKRLVAAVDGRELPGRLKTELHASIVELNTEPCPTAALALEALRELRWAAAEAARGLGLVLAAAGTHPLVRPESLPIVPEPRYLEFVEYAGPSARRQGVSGLHVHVAMPDGDGCHRTLEGVLPWLPVVLALSANSPYLAGAETGLMSNRAEVLCELPRSGAPPVFGSYAAWEAYVERLAELGVAADSTRYWWDVRPHPTLGTLELRMPDQPTSVELTGAFVALLQALAATALEAGEPAVDPAGRGLYQQNRWAASRFGPRANLVHPDGGSLAPAAELGAELLELVAPTARRLGSETLLARLDPARCEGDRQLEVGRADGLQAALADVAVRTVGSSP